MRAHPLGGGPAERCMSMGESIRAAGRLICWPPPPPRANVIARWREITVSMGRFRIVVAVIPHLRFSLPAGGRTRTTISTRALYTRPTIVARS
jgi:hypothetical protein